MARVKIIGIYLIKSPSGRHYVGQSMDIHKRFWGYLAMNNIDSQRRLGRSIRKYGSDAHVYEIIEECLLDDLNERERYWQDHYDVCGKSGLNCRLTETGDKSGVISYDTRQRQSESGKIRMARLMKDPVYMEKMKKAAEKRKGIKLRPRTQEEKDRMHKIVMAARRFGKDNNMYGSARFGEKNPFYNQKHTKESRKKISEKAKGRIPSIEVRKIWSKNNSLGGNPAAKIVLDTESGIYYSCGKEAWLASNRRFVYSTFKSKLNGSNKYPLQYMYV